MRTNQLPLIVILGPTASGKTGYAIRLAKIINGEIICADSRTVYRGMDIGTAKPTVAEQNGVPHWGLDLVEPNQQFNLHDFMVYANQKIAEIRQRGHVPMLVGGSCLYINGVIYHYELGGRMNKKYTQLDDNTVVIGIQWEKNKLLVRSRQRSEQMLASGLIEEYQKLLDKYGPVQPLQHNAYGVLSKSLPLVGRADEIPQGFQSGEGSYNSNESPLWLKGAAEHSEAGGLSDSPQETIPPIGTTSSSHLPPFSQREAVDAMVTADWHLMKKQLTWWRNKQWADDIMWRTLDDLNNQLNDFATQQPDQIIAKLMVEYKNFKTSQKSSAN